VSNFAQIGGILISAQEKRSMRGLTVAAIVAVALALLVILGFFTAGAILKNGDKVFPNVCVLGVNLGGLDRAEAEEALDEAMTAQTTRTLTVQLPDRKLVFEPQMTHTSRETAALAEKALNYGREGNALTVLRKYLDCKNSAYILDAGNAVEVDQAYIREMINKTAFDAQRTMKETEIAVNEEGTVITISIGRAGRTLNADKLFDAVVQAYRTGDLSDMTFDYDWVPYNLVDLQAYYAKYCTPAQDAYYDSKTNTLVKEVIGYGFDLMAVNQQIALAEEGSVVEVPLQEIQPRVTAENWKAENFPDVLASYSSPHINNANRTTNLKLACEAINGTVLEPGEVFTFNGIVGERTAERGYREGIVYADGGASEAEIGGGICQVASTIYMCVLLADMEVTEREPHMYTVTYVDMGMDATIYWGSRDFKFRNTNSTPIMINASVSGGKVHVSLVGIMEHDYTVKMTYEILSKIPYEEVEEEDPTALLGSRTQKWTPYTGYTCWTYKSYYDLNGNFIEKEKCAYSEYKKRDNVYLIGTMDPDEYWYYNDPDYNGNGDDVIIIPGDDTGSGDDDYIWYG
jgi:vancomycin resistance protein YoaR